MYENYDQLVQDRRGELERQIRADRLADAATRGQRKNNRHLSPLIALIVQMVHPR